MPISVDNQKHLIRSLMNLEWNGDAAWDAIISRRTYISKQIERTRDYHVQLESTEDEQGSITYKYLIKSVLILFKNSIFYLFRKNFKRS